MWREVSHFLSGVWKVLLPMLTSQSQSGRKYRLAVAISLFVVCGLPARAEVYEFVVRWGSPGGGEGQFGAVAGVAAGADGSVYVADNGFRRIHKFTSTGEFVTSWGTAGGGEGQFGALAGVAAGADSVYVADNGFRRIHKYSLRQSGGEGEGEERRNAIFECAKLGKSSFREFLGDVATLVFMLGVLGATSIVHRQRRL